MIRLGELLDGLEVEYRSCDASLELQGISADSREAGPGVAFLAVAGATHDGHGFLDAALDAGAPVVLVTRGREPARPRPCVALADTTAALPQIAANRHGWPGRALTKVGITGTNGKTTTTHLVGAVLEAAGRPFARLGTTGNWMVDRETSAAFTTPFPLELQALLAQARDRGARDLVMEVSSHALDQSRVEPLRYQAVALTSFSQDHLDYHADMETYLEAKLRLASHFLAEAGTAVAPIDGSEAGRRFLAATSAAATRLAVSKAGDPGAEIRAEKWRIAAAGIEATVQTPAGAFELRSPLVGEYNLDNLLVATGLALAIGVDLETIARGLAGTCGAPGRLERVRTEGASGPAVFVDYAHTPDAVGRAIDALRPTCEGKLVVLLGCGGDRDQQKRPLMGRIAGEKADLFVATSDNPRTEDPDTIVDQMIAGAPAGAHLIREVDRARAIARAIAEADAKDTILIAGKGHEDYQILGTRKIDFDDREHARVALAKRE